MIFYIEGPDLSGKTTLIKYLLSELDKVKIDCFAFKEPNGKIREAILSDRELDYMSERLYFLGNHIDVISKAKKIINNNPSAVILIDRCALVSDYIQMQATNNKAGIDFINQVRDPIMQNIPSNINKKLILLNASKETIISRTKKREINLNDKNDSTSLSFKINIAHRYDEFVDEKILSYFSDVKKFNIESDCFAETILKYILESI